MKAKVKSLGSVVDLSEYVYDEDGNEYTWDEVELIDDDKWQHYRIQAAIAAMQGMLANPAYQKVQVESGEPFGYFYAMNAIMCADVLIEELQKKGGQDD